MPYLTTEAMLITQFGLLAVHVKLHGPKESEKYRKRTACLCQKDSADMRAYSKQRCHWLGCDVDHTESLFATQKTQQNPAAFCMAVSVLRSLDMTT